MLVRQTRRAGRRILLEGANLRMSRRCIFYRKQFHFKNEGGIRPDYIAGAALAVRQVRRDKKLPGGSNRHQLESLLESGNNGADLKRRGLTRL